MKNKTQAGQALVETTLLIVFIFGMFFALVQLFILVTTRITAFDAAQSMARANIVGKNHHIAGMYVLSSQKLGSQVFPVEFGIKENISGGIITAKITYYQKLMFPGFFSSLVSMLPGDAVCRMVKSPEPEYLDKSHPGAYFDWKK